MASIHFHYSTMNAGKSANLLNANYNYIERGMKTLVLKPAIDTREAESVVRSRTGNETPCTLFGPEEDVYALVVKLIDTLGTMPKCIFIDECQFMSREQVWQLTNVVDELHIPVMCYGLCSDFQGNLFSGTAALFAVADRVVEVRTICWCGSKAYMVLRLDETGDVVREGDQIKVGGNDSYVSVCRRHFKAGLVRG